jgi:hypothetical protein
MDRGTALHVATEYDDEGTLDESSVDPNAAPHLCGWRRFKRESGIEILAREQFFYCDDLDYAGQIDVDCALNGVTGILDIKTGQRYRWHAVQLAAYAHARGDCPRWGLYVNPIAGEAMGARECIHPACAGLPRHGAGDYKLWPYRDAGDFDVWKAALIVAKAESKMIAASGDLIEAARSVVRDWLYPKGIERER